MDRIRIRIRRRHRRHAAAWRPGTGPWAAPAAVIVLGMTGATMAALIALLAAGGLVRA